MILEKFEGTLPTQEMLERKATLINPPGCHCF
jgi:hypothetical protein